MAVPDKDSESTVLNMLKGIKETRRTKSQQRENISKEIKITKSNQIEIVVLTSMVTETEYLLEVFNSTAEQQKKESVTLKIVQLQLCSLRSRKKKE